MQKLTLSIFTLILCLISFGCSKNEVTPEEPQEYYSSIGALLMKEEWRNGETMDIFIIPPNAQYAPPDHYNYIRHIEYFIDGESVGKSNETPFSITHTPNLSIGKHEISIKISLSKENVIWETKTTPFTIIE